MAASSRKDSEDHEQFWKSSSMKKRNIFDDEVSFEAAKKSILSFTHEDEDDDASLDVVNWDDTPAVKYSSNIPRTGDNHSASNLSNLAVPALSSRSSIFPPSSVASYGGFEKAAGLMTHNRSKSLGTKFAIDSGFSHSGVQRGSSDPSIDDVVGTISSQKQPSSGDVEKLQQEILFLRRTIQNRKRERWVKLPVEDTLRRLIRGEACTFEMYRSREDKLTLLDKAIELHDGNAITAAVLFLKQTVKSSIFNLELTRRPVAVNHYISYLRNHFDFAELADVLSMLGKLEEAAMLKYKLGNSSSDSSVKVASLKTALRAHFLSDPRLSHDATLVQEQIDLIERQRPIEESDARAEAEGKTQVLKDFPRKTSLLNTSVITTLFYCCMYHYDLVENSLASPLAVRKRHQLTDKQFLWTAIAARARLRKWKDIEVLLTAKGWFGGTKMKAVIGFDKVVEILHKVNSPSDILAKYLSLIEDQDLRLIVAKKVNCPKGIIEACVALKDRSELEAYAAKLKPRSQEAFYATDALQSSTIKWK